MIKDIKFNTEAREAVLKGINIVADAVKSTYGPNGRNVMIEIENDAPHITKDGVTVASSIQLLDPFESLGAQLIQGVASKTLKDVGDGTTTSTILTQALINEGLKELQFGVNPFRLKEGMDLAVTEITKKLKEYAKVLIKDSEEVKDVAKISANGDEFMSSMLYDIFKVIGKEGTVTVTDSTILDTYFTITEGIQLPNGYENPLFAKEDDKITFEKPYIHLSKEPIRNIQQIVPIIKTTQAKGNPLIIVAPEMDRGVLDQLIITNYQGNMKVVFVRMPAMTEVQRDAFDDLGVVVGKPFEMNQTTGGEVQVAHIEQYSASLIPYNHCNESITSLKESLKSKINPNDNGLSANKLRERVAKLSGKVATIFVAAGSEVELKEKKDRLDDAIHAVKAALDEGIVQGAGLTLYKAAEEVYLSHRQLNYDKDVHAGIDLVDRVCNIPKTILGRDSSDKSEVIDPVKVVYTTLQNANSVAGLFLTTNCVIVNKN